MTNYNYTPRRQDVIWINFKPSTGQEIKGRHPAVVISTSVYSKLTGLVLVAPITHASNNRLRDFFLPITHLKTIEGYINPLQFYTFSYVNRHAKFSGEVLDDGTFALLQRRVKEIVD